jgi:tRNA(Ile)-lysidine synthase TilS/MesJ/rhodanese-related sulfurtransferase
VETADFTLSECPPQNAALAAVSLFWTFLRENAMISTLAEHSRAGKTGVNMNRRTIEELQADVREKIIYDIRKEEDFSKETYPGAVHLYWEDFPEHKEELPKDRPIYLLCYTGEKSDELTEELTEEGYEVYSVVGGYREYLRMKLTQLMQTEDGKEDRCKEIERSIVKKFRKEIWRKFTKAINEYEMIQDGDKIAVCISGGKDSMLMAKLFQELERHGKKNFEVVFLVMNPGYNEENYRQIVENAKLLNVPITVFTSEIFDIVAGEGNSPCYLCARMRRGHLYSKAKELGCNKIALGHHFDDVIETIVMGMLYGAQIQTMMPKLHSTNFPGMELIRPLYLVRESDIIHWMNYNDLHFIQCACRFTENCASCGGTEKGSMRADVKALIRELSKKNPYIEKNIFRSVENVNLNTVIAYKQDGVKHHFLETYDEKTSTD